MLIVYSNNHKNMSSNISKFYKKTVNDKILNIFIPEVIRIGLVSNEKEFCEMLNLRPQNLISIKIGKTSFTVKHIGLLGKKFNMNINWLFDYEENMFRKLKK